MLSNNELDIINEALRVLFIAMIPFLISVSVCGLISAVLQSTLGAREQAITYGLGLLSVVITAYLFFENISSSLIELALLCFK